MQSDYVPDSNLVLANSALRAPKKRRRRCKPIDGRTRTARRIRELLMGYLAAIGGTVSPQLRERCERAAQLVTLAEDVRRKALGGRNISLDDVIRVENAADRARRSIGLDQKPRGPTFVPLRERLMQEAEVAEVKGVA